MAYRTVGSSGGLERAVAVLGGAAELAALAAFLTMIAMVARLFGG